MLLSTSTVLFILFFVCISLTADGPQVTNPTYCNVAILPVVPKDLPISPRFSPTNWYRDASSALLHLN